MNIIGVNSLRLGGLHSIFEFIRIVDFVKYVSWIFFGGWLSKRKNQFSVLKLKIEGCLKKKLLSNHHLKFLYLVRFLRFFLEIFLYSTKLFIYYINLKFIKTSWSRKGNAHFRSKRAFLQYGVNNTMLNLYIYEIIILS